MSTKPRGRAPAVERLYAAAVAQARQPVFYVDLGVPDTLDGRFELLVLHVHLLCRRLSLHSAGPEGAAMAQALFDTMFHDMDRNLREMGVGDPSLPRRIKAMIKAYFGRIAAYEAAAGDEAAAAAAISRNVFGREDASGAAAIARYMERAGAALAAQLPDALARGDVAFPPVEAAGQGA